MNNKQLIQLISRQIWLKNNADIEMWCHDFKSTEMDFWKHHLWIWALKHDIIDYIPKGIGDTDYSEGVRFEE